MTKPAKSQWDFGELFPTEQTRKVLSVWELTSDIKRLLEKQIGLVWVSGEITNLRAQSSGHIYFTLKDVAAQLSCVLFKGGATKERALLADGQKVLLQGDVTVYEARGQYQLIVRAVELQGVGALQIQFEKLKQKLQAEGLFAPERKRPLPQFPQRIGLVTSPTGAAIRDVLHVIGRRNPSLEIVLAPCRVQGGGAAREIAEAIRMLSEVGSSRCDDRTAQRAVPTIFCFTRSSEDLHRRINVRADEMFRLGLVDETRGLLQHGLAENKFAMQAIGYRQVVEHLRGERGLAETIELVKIRTRQFAKRQLTWFRRHGNCQWLELAPDETVAETVVKLASQLKIDD